jgi:cytochrome c-type biogenesis protein CcsB
MKNFLKIIPWFFLALFATEIIVVFLPKKDGEFHTREFGRLPVLLNGRIQPFDSVARNSLLQIRSTGDVPLEEVPSWKFWHHPKKLRSTEWLLEVLFRPDTADTRPIFLIHHPEILSELKLNETGVEKSGLRYYTYKELEPVLQEIGQQGRKARGIEEAQQTTYHKQISKLANAVILYQRLKNSLQPENTTDLTKLITDFQAAMPAGLAAFRAQQSGQPADTAALKRFTDFAQQFDVVANYAYPLTIPPIQPEPGQPAWVNLGASVLGAIQTGEIHPAVQFFARMATGYSQQNAAEFNSAIAGYKNWLAPKYEKEVRKGRAEFYFNDVKAFLHATIIYIFALILACGAILTYGTSPNFSESLRRSAFYLIALAFAVHTFGLVFRMVLEGRPPVTNLYSSAIFIGWGACVLGLILERIYRVGLGSAVAGLTGFITLLIAHNLALGGDTMEMLRAVLDTNFWLATHVVTITIGYSATFFAGLLGIAYILLGLLTPLLTRKLNETKDPEGKSASPELGKALANMVYGIVCFATLFSFIGTVLGGIWADQSWGRFWGWDPKENGALLIVLWNAIILHARWGGLVKERGLMNLAIFGNIITAFSWFGVNMLGIGLHSYGFMDSGFVWLYYVFVPSQIVMISLGLLPKRLWRSFQTAV